MAQPLWSHPVPWEELDSTPWYLGVRSPVRNLFNRLRAQGPFLGDDTICERIFQGIKTSLDPVYVMDVVSEEQGNLRVSSKALDSEVVLERELLKPIVKGREMKRFAPLPSRKVVLVPYTITGNEASLIPANEFKTEYPKTWSYLVANRSALEARERGRMKHSNWYAYIYPKNLTLFRRPKLMTADMAAKMSFSIDREGGTYLLGGAGGGYGLLPTKTEYVAPLLAVLNSQLLEWMLRPPGFSSPFRGGWFSCEARFINLLPIRNDSADFFALGPLAMRLVEAYRRLNVSRSERDQGLYARQIEGIEAEIDDRVFALYGVTAVERREVEKVVAEARAVSERRDEDEDPRLRLFIEKRIVSRPDILGGEPVFKGTRISVRDVGERVKRGESVSEVLEDFPSLQADDVELARLYVINSPSPVSARTLEFIRGEG